MIDEAQKEIQIEKAKSIADWLEVDFSISVFGVKLVSWHFPPRKK